MLSVLGMGGVVLGILVWQEGGESVVALVAVGAVALGSLVRWLRRRHRVGAPTLLDPDLFTSPAFRLGITEQMLQQIALGGTMIALPIFLQMVLEYNAMQAGLSLAPLSLSMFGVALLAGKKAGAAGRAASSAPGSRSWRSASRAAADRAPGGVRLGPGDPAGRRRVRAGAARVAAQQLHARPVSEERVSEAAGVNSAAGSFGLSFGLAFAGAILWQLSLAFTDMAQNSDVLPPDDKEQVASALEDDAEVMSNTQLEELLVDEPEDVQDEILRINTDARPLALRVRCSCPCWPQWRASSTGSA